MYILTTDLMTDYDKWQTRPLVREGAPYWQDCNFQNIISGDRPTDWPSVIKWLKFIPLILILSVPTEHEGSSPSPQKASRLSLSRLNGIADVPAYLGGPAKTAAITVLALVRTGDADRNCYHAAYKPCNLRATADYTWAVSHCIGLVISVFMPPSCTQHTNRQI
jgi:hypothetical protein